MQKAAPHKTLPAFDFAEVPAPTAKEIPAKAFLKLTSIIILDLDWNPGTVL
jgi:hypothetical protein